MKITFLTVMPSPYVQDLFAAMHDDDRIDLQVLYMEQVAPDTYWGEQQMPSYARVLSGRWIGFSGARIHVNPGIKRILDERSDDLVIVVGYVGITNQIAIRHLTRNNRPWAFWGEIPGLHQRGSIGRWLRRLAQSPLRNASGLACVGSHAVEAYRRLLSDMGAEQGNVKNIPYHCDTQPYESAKRDRQPSANIRFLYCGQLIERKGVDLLYSAFLRLADEYSNVELTFAGEGPLRASLETECPERFRDRMKFSGFVEVADLPKAFGQNDVFILSSRHDGWGVVVNQAIAAEMPVIATTAVGAGNDLVRDEENGFVVPTESSEALYTAMKRFVAEPALVKSFGEVSACLAETISLKSAVNDWHHFFTDCLNNKEDQ